MKLTEILSEGGPTKVAEQVLDDLASALDIPSSRYEAAERSFKSLGSWLNRPDSFFAKVRASVFPQGSFRLGTVIRPLSDDEDYDLDLVCEVNIGKLQTTQAELKRLLGNEVSSYAKAQNMSEPKEARRCWTLNYADEAQFHMDVLPALPDGTRQRVLLEVIGASNEWTGMSVAITDTEHPNYRIASEEWPSSNPKGYSEWFWSRMKTVFDTKRQALALLEKKAKIEDIPEYRVKTPLQAAIQILKRHRDIRFADNTDDRPISIILTTLAAQAYEQESTISGALYGILARMDQFVEDRNGITWIPNPTDPRENFADKWVAHPERRTAFFEWLGMARADFRAAANLTSVDELVEALAPRLGRRVVESAVEKRRSKGILERVIEKGVSIGATLQRVLGAPHRQAPTWPVVQRGEVSIVSATMKGRGKPIGFRSDGFPLPKGGNLVFEAKTNVPQPFQVYWQVVNTGREATARNQLRGGFDVGTVEQGRLIRKESSSYTGTHSIECFIVKDGYCVARSGAFIVNVA